MVVGLANCSQSRNGETSVTPVAISDTIVSIENGNTIKKYSIKRELVGDIHDCLEVIKQFADKLEYYSEDSVDITGTGEQSIYTTSIVSQGDGFLVTNRIKSDKQTIWLDTMLINDRLQYYWDDDVYYALKPGSQFCLAHEYFRQFVEDPLDSNAEQYGYLKQFFLQTIDDKSDSAYWASHLNGFSGRTIRNLSPESPTSYIWDNRKRRFIQFYAP